MAFAVSRPIVTTCVAVFLAACNSLPEPQPLVDAPETRLARGEMVDGTITVRNNRGRILFSAPSSQYRFGREIRIHPYDSTGTIDVSIENEDGVVVSQRLRGGQNREIGIFYNRALGGFKQRFYMPDNWSR